tara:strand:- start:1568 stop:1837 length:270 start_codon:yes stop_codon:yes gene_type:complete
MDKVPINILDYDLIGRLIGRHLVAEYDFLAYSGLLDNASYKFIRNEVYYYTVTCIKCSIDNLYCNTINFFGNIIVLVHKKKEANESPLL